MSWITRMSTVLSWSAVIAAVLSMQAVGATEQRKLRFEVQLDESPIGFHRYRIDRRGPVTIVDSEAEFKVRFLLFTAYRYSHEHREVWEGNCLAELSSRTDDNGKAYTVHGGRSADGFDVNAKQGQATLEACVMSFAYWNPAILRQGALINGQTGRLEPVDVVPAGEELIETGRGAVMAERYQLTAGEKQIVVWYGPSGEWLGLESEVKNGRKLRYVLAEDSGGTTSWADSAADAGHGDS